MVIRLRDVEYDNFTLAQVASHPEPFRLLNRVPIVDNGEPLVDLRETNPELSFNDYCLPYVRASVAEALNAAISRVPDYLELRIFTALRTLEQQAEMYWGNYHRNREQHPEWPESVLRKMTNRFFAPPDAKAPPGHCTGGAVDVGLHRRDTGEGLDMRSPLEGWNGAPTAVHGLSPEASENRRRLCHVMHATGLSNCRDEFWHWSYGDSAWAVRVGEETACYGWIEPPPDSTRVVGEKVELRSYNPEWPRHFEEIRGSLAHALGPLAARIEHVGSTAIPGMSAFPILDIDIMVENTEAMKSLIDALVAFGYEHQSEQGVRDREDFRAKFERSRPEASWPAHQICARVEGGTELRKRLAFRDHLRANRVAAAEYASLKTNLAARFPWDRVRYNRAKEPFVAAVLSEIHSSFA